MQMSLSDQLQQLAHQNAQVNPPNSLKPVSPQKDHAIPLDSAYSPSKVNTHPPSSFMSSPGSLPGTETSPSPSADATPFEYISQIASHTAENANEATTQNRTETSGEDAAEGQSPLESAWKRMVSTVKQTFDSVLAPTQSAVEKEVNSTSGSGRREADRVGTYTQEEIDDLVSDILHQLHLHQDDMRAHREMLRSSGRWDPNSLTHAELARRIDVPILVLRSSVIVSPEVLADAVTTSTKKMLLSKGKPIPWPVASRMLVDVHSRLADLVEPVEIAKAQHAAPSPSSYSSFFRDADAKKKYIGEVVNSAQSRIKADPESVAVPKEYPFKIPQPNPYDTTTSDFPSSSAVNNVDAKQLTGVQAQALQQTSSQVQAPTVAGSEITQDLASAPSTQL